MKISIFWNFERIIYKYGLLSIPYLMLKKLYLVQLPLNEFVAGEFRKKDELMFKVLKRGESL